MDQAVTLRELAKGGRKDFPSFSISENEKSINSRKRVISVTSGKGGVGKTNIVTNLAFAISQLGKRVLVLDADLGLGNIDVLLGIVPKYNLLHVINGMKKISEVILNGPGKIMILPASSGVLEITNLTDQQKMHLLEEFESIEDDVDVLLIDTGAGISTNVMYFNVAAQEIVVVVSPEPTSITDAYAMMKVLSLKYSENHFKLLVNSVSGDKEAMNVFRNISLVAEKFLNISIDYLGYIPRDENIVKAVKQQKLFIELYPDGEASKSIKSLAKKINGDFNPVKTRGNIQFFLKQFLNGYGVETI